VRHLTASFWKELVVLVVGIIAVIALSPFLLIVGLGKGIYRAIWGAMLRRRFRRTRGREGKVAVLVYSDSPNWKEYIEREILPSVRDRVVTLNWSLRSEWKRNPPLEAQMFQYWGGTREFNPMAIIVPPKGRVRLIRFWKAFKEYKHGKPHSLTSLREELQEAVRAT
jgi:hypothetical protein